MKKIFSLLVLCATVVFASCSKDDPVTEPVPEGITVTTYDALLDALQTGGASADAPTLITLGGDITIPAGGDNNNPPINGSGHFKIDGGGHTLTWEGEGNNFHFLGNSSPDADAVYIELTNINLVRQGMNSAVAVLNGRITLGKDVALNGQYENMILASGEKAALELGDGCELSYTTDRSYCVSVWNGATLVLNGGKTAAGAYIDLGRNFDPAASHPLISVPKALTGDVQLLLTMTGVTSIAQGAGGYQLTQADCDRLKVNPESMVSLYGEPHQKYGDNFELYLDPAAEHQIKLRLKNFTPPTSGNIDMTSMTADEAQLTILAAVAAGFTEIKLTGELSKTGIGGNWGTFINNKKITKCDLTGVTDWGRTPTLPDVAFANCTALQEVTLPGDMKVIGGSAFSGCAALTTVNLSQVTRINLSAFWGCTSLETLALDNVTAIGQEAFYGCTGLETLKIPKCTEFGTYIVSGCRSLTRIEATAAGNFVDISDGRSSIERTAVFHNRDSHYGDSAFNPANCALVLNADKKQDGNATPKVFSDNEWLVVPNGQFMRWNSITFAQQ
ncbi:leucine-rich repeat domain-containing protein [Bacteroides ovatus]|mgnify:CR=1 FL=1|uniref:leucine-rich repeat domain-containing protein n=1 Tax=Bacteroides ovatus TaxID=28116 RepID=UPI001C3758E8|nr:leucine-rich repeat domain-containing protein [Bacteroides ovatus]MBV3310939.1 leucine-rich repeat domain-containing protein [Bacteroides ovatus]MCS2297072.1 leucine-rich repeat domain-containing protein [Bacteroides ovatus]UYI63288.1 MAG: leucine-rich repeat domain-containing protein [Bacteroides ovatus]